MVSAMSRQPPGTDVLVGHTAILLRGTLGIVGKGKWPLIRVRIGAQGSLSNPLGLTITSDWYNIEPYIVQSIAHNLLKSLLVISRLDKHLRYLAASPAIQLS